MDGSPASRDLKISKFDQGGRFCVVPVVILIHAQKMKVQKRSENDVPILPAIFYGADNEVDNANDHETQGF